MCISELYTWLLIHMFMPSYMKAQTWATNINYKNQPILALHHSKAYAYLGKHLVSTLNSNIQLHITTTKVVKQCESLTTYLATIKQKINMVDIVIWAQTAYSFYVVPYFLPIVNNLDKKTIALQYVDYQNAHQTLYSTPSWFVWNWSILIRKNTYL